MFFGQQWWPLYCPPVTISFHVQYCVTIQLDFNIDDGVMFLADSSVPSSQLLRLTGPGGPPGLGGGTPLPPQEQPGLPLQQDHVGSWCSGQFFASQLSHWCICWKSCLLGTFLSIYDEMAY